MLDDKVVPYIQICRLGTAREADIEAYDGIITIENSEIEEPFRVVSDYPPQRVLTFDDIAAPMDNWVVAEEYHVRSALVFVRQWDQPSLLIHCHAGMSRSPAIALAILADHFGDGEKAIEFCAQFMRDVVANMDNDWTLTSDEIDNALNGGA